MSGGLKKGKNREEDSRGRGGSKEKIYSGRFGDFVSASKKGARGFDGRKRSAYS